MLSRLFDGAEDYLGVFGHIVVCAYRFVDLFLGELFAG